MLTINPSQIFPFMKLASTILEILQKTPIPKRHLTKIVETEIDNKKEFVVVMKVSYEKKEDAENFVNLDSKLDHLFTIFKDSLKEEKKEGS